MYQIKYLKEIDSTNSELKRLAFLGAPSGTVLVADRQTAGRGRLGRAFYSPSDSGNYMSVLLRPVRLSDAGLLTTFTAVAVARALSKNGIEVGIKWVNDLVAGGRKLCGILAESGVYEKQPFAIIGIGINLKKTAFPEELRGIAVSLEELSGTAPDRDTLVRAILEELEKANLQCPRDPAALMDEYRRRSVTVGNPVRVLPHNGEAYDAFAQAIADDGSLTVRTADGRTINVSSGEVSVKNRNG